MKKDTKSAKREKKPSESVSPKRTKAESLGREKVCDVFDLGRIERLVELMKVNDLTEIDLAHGEHRIQLRRDNGTAVLAPAAIPVPASAAVPVPVSAPAPAAPSAEESSAIKEVVSPMVGTFYLSPTPDAPAFVKVGDLIGPEKTVCIIEAMKVFNEIQAELAGRVVAVLAKNGDGVEYGQPLFKIDTRG